MSAKIEPSIPALAKSLEWDVCRLCLPKGRKVGGKGHADAENFLRGRLQEIGCTPYRGRKFDLDYKVKGVAFKNLLGVVKGADSSLPPLLIGAHYDSVIAAPCADDNGAAVAICLALTEIFAEGKRLRRDLVVALFDAEEPPFFRTPLMGSERFYADQMDKRGVHLAVIFDLVGHDISVPSSFVPGLGGLFEMVPGVRGRDLAVPTFGNALFMTGAESHSRLAALVKAAGPACGLKLLPTLNEYVGDMSDHGAFRKGGVPYLFFSCGHWAHYHMETDTPDRLNYRKMAHITRYVAEVLIVADRRKLEPDARKPADTLSFEVAQMRSGLGVLYPLLLRWAGLSKIRSRADMDSVVEKLLILGL